MDTIRFTGTAHEESINIFGKDEYRCKVSGDGRDHITVIEKDQFAPEVELFSNLTFPEFSIWLTFFSSYDVGIPIQHIRRLEIRRRGYDGNRLILERRRPGPWDITIEWVTGTKLSPKNIKLLEQLQNVEVQKL